MTHGRNCHSRVGAESTEYALDTRLRGYDKKWSKAMGGILLRSKGMG